MRRDGGTLPWRRLLIVSAGWAGLLLTLPAWSESGPAAGLSLEEQVQVCAVCHGEDGNSMRENTPSLAGQPALTITNQMIYFRERLRRSEEMTPQARGLSDAEIQALAAYYAEQPIAAPEGERDDALIEKGRTLSRQQRCASCHGSSYQGREQMPRLAGQREDYLTYAMKAYRERTRGGPDTTMIDIMRGVDDEAIEALAHFFAHFERE